jgi:hypothetical protein
LQTEICPINFVFNQLYLNICGDRSGPVPLTNQMIEKNLAMVWRSLFIKVITKNNDYLYEFLVKKLQHIEEIQSTETLISFRNPIQRMVTL